ncbi:antitoxin [Salmonella enterica subsp. enterica]|uniref:Antitoxin n=1 Tax=Salmonella enterica I TaxID=59201 RepID=A0A379WJG4_SALET|nr:antitoxin [Salmonella enterica subsp. enterica]
MRTVNYSEARQNLAEVLESAGDGGPCHHHASWA